MVSIDHDVIYGQYAIFAHVHVVQLLLSQMTLEEFQDLFSIRRLKEGDKLNIPISFSSAENGFNQANGSAI